MDQVSIGDLRKYILDEVTYAFGFPKKGLARLFVGGVFHYPANRFARLTAEFDKTLSEQGFQTACDNLLSQFTDSLQVEGVENIPKDGPLLVACNHPGAFDSVVLASSVPRTDVKGVVSGVPLLDQLPTVSPYLILAPADTHERMKTVRLMIRHLRGGGALLIFASGRVDPDPAVLEGAHQALNDWSPSLEIAMRRVPETRLVPAIISGVLSPNALRIPLVRLQKEAWKQRRLAEYFQVAGQLLFPSRFRFNPRITFGKPLTIFDLRRNHPSSSVMMAIIEHAKELLDQHQEATRNPGTYI